MVSDPKTSMTTDGPKLNINKFQIPIKIGLSPSFTGHFTGVGFSTNSMGT